MVSSTKRNEQSCHTDISTRIWKEKILGGRDVVVRTLEIDVRDRCLSIPNVPIDTSPAFSLTLLPAVG